MKELSVPVMIRAGATGIADTEKDGMAANAQAAKPINTKRFIWTSPWMAAGSGGTEQCHCVAVPGAANVHASAALRVHGSDSCNWYIWKVSKVGLKLVLSV